jgi:hypothetical protein
LQQACMPRLRVAGTGAVAPGSAGSTGTTNTAQHYPRDATHYVVGEVYYPNAPTAEGDASRLGQQKLLQMERTLRFLCAKEGREDDPLQCIMGALFLGPHLDSGACAALYSVLAHYQSALPLLWALQKAGRVLACRTANALLTPAIAFQLKVHVKRLEERLAEQRRQDEAERRRLEERLAEQLEEQRRHNEAEQQQLKTQMAQLRQMVQHILGSTLGDGAVPVPASSGASNHESSTGLSSTQLPPPG